MDVDEMRAFYIIFVFMHAEISLYRRLIMRIQVLSTSVLSADFRKVVGCDLAVHVHWSHAYHDYMDTKPGWWLDYKMPWFIKIVYNTLNHISSHFAVLTIPWLLMHIFHGKCLATWQTLAFNDIVVLASLPIYQAKISCSWLFLSLIHSLHLTPFPQVLPKKSDN